MLELHAPHAPGRSPEETAYREVHRSADLSIGIYAIPTGGYDAQTPHTEDEVYVVLAGRARLAGSEQTIDVGPGSVVFVGAGESHRFVDVHEPLSVLVVFGPPEYSRDGS